MLTPIAGLIGLLIAGVILSSIVKKPGGEGKVAEIAEKIQRGAMVFMKREFLLISIFAAVIAIALFLFQDEAYVKLQAGAFLFGCIASSLVRFVGMYLSLIHLSEPTRQA